TQPCMTLSSHTAPDVQPLLERLCLVQLASGQGRTTQPLRSSPIAVLTDPGAFEGGERILASIAKAGETSTYGMEPDELGSRLQTMGLTLVEDLGADDYRSRYWHSARSHCRGYSFYRAALVTTPSRAET